ncbi:MAG TPA: beta-propeller fold lactonase family protein [Bryobacteraceae bacterium]|nr:beta-propeller fold lactonase family protein [Bryobacteraceae bacterium]
MKNTLQHTITAFTFAVLATATLTAQTSGNTSPSNEPIVLPTGLSITPTAAPHSALQLLNPGVPTLPTFTADHPVTTALSPDGTQLLILTSGYNEDRDLVGQGVTNEYVFVFDTTVFPPKQQAVFPIPNAFCGLAWNPNGQEFYVSGGVDDKVYIFSQSGTAGPNNARVYSQAATVPLGHKIGLGLLSNAPPPFNASAPPPMAGGIAVGQSGTIAVVANFFNDSISVVDLKGRAKIAELDLRPGVSDRTKTGVAGGEYPFWVAIVGDNKAYISSQRDRELVVVNLAGTPQVSTRIPITGQPNKMILTKAQALLYVAVDNSDSVAVVNTASDQVVASFSTTAPLQILPGSDLPKGANPNSLALSPDEKTLYVTNGGSNSVAVVALNPAGGSHVIGLIPTGWYPTSVSVSLDGQFLHVVNAKSVPGPSLGQCRGDVQAPGILDCAPLPLANTYVLQLEKGGLLSLPVPGAVELADLTSTVASNNRFQAVNRGAGEVGSVMSQIRSQIQHVIYIIKENRTYDQVLGDLEVGNGDPALTEFPEPLTPNHHAMARNFVTLDNFYDSGEVSGVGWNWSTAARATDFTEKTVPLNYAGRGLTYDWEGTNRNVNVGIASLAARLIAQPLLSLSPALPADPNLLPGAVDVAGPDGPAGEAGAGYIWDEALRAGLTVRNYGFYIDLARYQGPASANPAYVPISSTPAVNSLVQAYTTKNSLLNYTDPYFRGFDQANADFYNYQEWAREFNQFVANGNLPSLSLVRFPHDHFGSFSTALYGLGTPGMQIADNDFAVGQLIQTVAASPYAANTLIFVIEDDAQDGPDHVDAHRSIAFVVGPCVKQKAVVSTHYTTVNMVRTMEEVLGLSPSSLNSAAASPMTDVFDPYQTNWNYTAIVPNILRTSQLPMPAASERNSLPASKRVRKYSKDNHSAEYWQDKLGDEDYSEEDKLDTDRFNQALWKGMMGNKPYPTARDGKDLRQNRQALLAQYGIR